MLIATTIYGEKGRARIVRNEEGQTAGMAASGRRKTEQTKVRPDFQKDKGSGSCLVNFSTMYTLVRGTAFLTKTNYHQMEDPVEYHIKAVPPEADQKVFITPASILSHPVSGTRISSA